MIDTIYSDPNFLKHHGVKGMRWGVRKDVDSVFISGSSKTQDPESGYFRKDLPKPIRKEIDYSISKKDRILVGDAPGIDRQVQDYLNSKHYENVLVYGPGTKVRYSANKNWETKPINAPEFEPGSKEWLAKKDIQMTNDSTRGLAIVLDEGSRATRNNISRLIEQNKNVKVYQLSKKSSKYDAWE